MEAVITVTFDAGSNVLVPRDAVRREIVYAARPCAGAAPETKTRRYNHIATAFSITQLPGNVSGSRQGLPVLTKDAIRYIGGYPVGITGI